MNSSTHYSVFAVVVTYNGERWVRSCLGSLTVSDYPITVIVVDNQSTDSTVKIIETDFPDVRLIRNPVNSGFGHANNMGIREALNYGADYVFLLNQDAWIQADTIRKLIDVARKCPEYGVVSPLHFDGAGKHLDTAFANYLEQSGQRPSTTLRETNPIVPVNFINAAAWLVTGDALKVVGGFGPLFVQYGEDRDYVQRLRFHGLRIGFISSTRIFHDRLGRSFDFSVNTKFVWYYYTGCLVRLVDVNYSFVKAGLRVFIWCAGDCIKFSLKGRFYAPIAFMKVFLQLFKKKKDMLSYRRMLQSKKQLLFLDR